MLMSIGVIARWQVEACIISLNRQSCWSFTRRTLGIITLLCLLPILQTCYIWHELWKMHCMS